MEKLKLEKWADAGYPPIDLNNHTGDVLQLIKDRSELRLALRLTNRVREAQKAYFKTRDANLLMQSKMAEKDLDLFLGKYSFPEFKF